MLAFLDPIPIPTPVLSEDEFSKAVQSTQALATAVNNITALGVLALVVILGILYILVIGRRQTNNVQPLLTSIEKDREERKELLERLFERDKEREDKRQEAIEALAITSQESKAILTALNTRDMQAHAFNERLTAALELMAEKGSTPVQRMAATIEMMKQDGVKPDKSAQEQLDRIEVLAKETNQKAKDCRETDEVLQTSQSARELLMEINRNLELFKRWLESGIEEVKHKSKPIPTVKPDESDAEALPKAS